MKPQVVVFIFRRDLRVVDNLALHALHTAHPSIPILPIFIFNPNQIDPSKNAYFSNPAVEFMIESLQDLESHTGKLYYFEGQDIDILEQLIKQVRIEAIAFNFDYTPFAKKRDDAIMEWCARRNIECIGSAEDYNLMMFDQVKTETGGSYEVFTPFYRKCLKLATKVPVPLSPANVSKYNFVSKITIQNMTQVKNPSKYIQSPTPLRFLQGGRRHALVILDKIKNKQFKLYDKERDYPALAKTTHLSAYMKFGNVSVREVFWITAKTHGLGHGLVREYIWRFFYAYITYHHPQLLQHQIGKTSNQPMKTKYASLPWENDTTKFKAWCEGRTGFPIVDAAMISMNQTGFMHNRLRMVVATFLTKDMHIDWTWGERYFASKLVDYDPCSNSGGWTWCASVGADAQPYYRIFNPWIQSKKFDNEGVFIKKWLPQLSKVPAKHLHEWFAIYENYKNIKYPPPLLDHSIESQKAIEMFTSYSLA